MFQKESFRKNIKSNQDNWYKFGNEQLQFDINSVAATALSFK